jgi:hypothetical protein
VSVAFGIRRRFDWKGSNKNFSQSQNRVVNAIMSSEGDVDSDTSPFVMTEWIRAAVTGLIQEDGCGRCLQGRAAGLGKFVDNIASLTPSEKKLCILTALSVLFVAQEARPERVRSSGQRQRFHYYVPFVGRVCQKAFLKLFNISAATLARYKRQMRRGWLVG